MNKETILHYFQDINHAYNDCTKHDTLKAMLDELEQEPCTVTGFADRCMECGKILGDMIKKRNGIAEAQEPCDAVSRDAVLRLFATHDGKYLYEAIRELPSVHPECTEDYCPAAFMPTMIYPQVEGITPTVVEPCTDAISREEVIKKAIYGYSINIEMSRGIEQYKTQITDMLQSVHEAQKKLIENLPSVTPAEKVGRWKRKIVDSGYNADWICNKCGYKDLTDFPTKYCPNCGSYNGGGDNGNE